MLLNIGISVLALSLVLAIIPLARRWMLEKGLTDQPGGRKKHEVPTPQIGGMVLFPVFIICSLFLIKDWNIFAPYLTALTLLLVVGAWDDHKPLPARFKFLVQIIAACLVVFAGQTYVIHLGDLFGFGIAWLGPFKQIFTVLALVLLINGMNLMDGLDGLAGGVGFIVMSFLTVVALFSGSDVMLGPLMVCTACLGGFLFYNMRRPGREKASVFMGDAGALSLGLTAGWFSIHMASGTDAVIEPISIAWLLTLPIIDTCAQFTRRMLQGRHPFDSDYHHFHYHFITAGVPHGKAVFYVLLTTFVGCFIGVFLPLIGVPAFVLTYMWIALFFGHIYMSLRPRRFRRAIKRLLIKEDSKS